MEDRLQPYRGGTRLLRGGLLAGLVGLVVFVVTFVLSPRQALFSYLAAFAFALAISLGALLFLAITYVMKARWLVVFRRVPESVGGVLPLFALLFLPIAFGVRELYLWADPPHELPAHLEHALHHKEGWLNVPAFLVRSVVYLATWIVFAVLLRRWSVLQDRDADLRWTVRLRRLGAGAVPALALTLTFAAFDWFMSLTPEWISSVYGVYFFAGGFQAFFALCILLVRRLETTGPLAGLVTAAHYHALGKLLFAFTIFWAYINFSQFFVIWIGNLPEETPWWIPRVQGWAGVSVFLVFARFVLPFFLLLSREVKRNPPVLSAIAGWVLAAHFVDAYWLVLPTLHPDGPAPHVADLAALLFVAGAAAAAIAWRLRGAAIVPARDPGFEFSTRYQGI